MNKLALFGLAALGLVSSASATALYGVTGDNQLVTFDTASPSNFTSSVQITGLVQSNGVTADPFASIVNLSYNYNDGKLYGVDTNANFYRIGSNGSATLMSATLTPNGFESGLGFDPFAGAFVYGTDLGEHFNIGTNGAVTSGPDFAYSIGDAHAGSVPSITGLAFDPAFGTAYFLDATLDTLSMSLDPGLGEIFTLGDLGIDVASLGDLAVDFDGNLYATLSTDGLTTSLYQINTTTGQATSLGSYGAGNSLITIAVPEPSAALLGGLGALALLRRRRA